MFCRSFRMVRSTSFSVNVDLRINLRRERAVVSRIRIVRKGVFAARRLLSRDFVLFSVVRVVGSLLRTVIALLFSIKYLKSSSITMIPVLRTRKCAVVEDKLRNFRSLPFLATERVIRMWLLF